MNVHIVGGTGFLGRRLIPRLKAADHTVTGLARTAASARTLEELGVHVVRGDLEDPHSVEAALSSGVPDALITSVSFTLGYVPHIVSTSERVGVRRAIFVSSTSIVTKLDAPSKPVRIEAEERIRSSTLEWTIIRPTMIYGGRDDRNLVRLLRFIERSPIVPLPGESAMQQPVHVDDVAPAIVCALTEPAAFRRTYDLAGPAAMTLRDLAAETSRALDRRVSLVPLPLGPVVRIARLYERFSRRPRIRAEQFERLAEDKEFDISAARQDLGFAPRPFAQGIREEAELLRAVPARKRVN